MIREISAELNTFLGWCDEIRNSSVRKIDGKKIEGFSVRANADQPNDAKNAFNFGAEGIGLCRTEHMFFDKDKLIHFRAMIASDTQEQRKDALKNILPLQKKDFIGIFEAMNGRPVTIRLLDPPLHEFIPHTDKETAELAKHAEAAGATAVSIGAGNFVDPETSIKTIEGIENYMKKHNIDDINSIIGTVQMN